jgi:hypothetical protein
MKRTSLTYLMLALIALLAAGLSLSACTGRKMSSDHSSKRHSSY